MDSIQIVSNTQSCSDAINELIKLKPSILGLDCEWVGKNKISLLQIAHPQLILLIRLHKLRRIPLELLGLLMDNKILKCGVGIYNDAAKLRYYHNIETFGCVDMNDIFPLLENDGEILTDFYGYTPSATELKGITFGLNKFSKMLLKSTMEYKDKKIARSNWEIDTLSKQQIHYAADDALIGYKLFKKVMEIAEVKDDQDEYLSFVYGNIDIHHYTKTKDDCKYSKEVKLKCSSSKTGKSKSNQSKKKNSRNYGKSKAFFDNCKILKPNGEILSCCSAKGMRWYLKKGLAEVVDEKTVKLNFEPKIRGLKFDEYHQSVKESQCFVCGIRDNLCKFAVVPECYRQYIDDKYNDKANRIHDCIPLCISCNKRGAHCQNMVRDRLCKQYSVPHYKLDRKTAEYSKLYKAKKAAWALTSKGKGKKNKIPIKRKLVLLQDICDFGQLEYEIIYSESEQTKENINDMMGYDDLIRIKGNEDGITNTEIINAQIDKLNEMKNDNLDKKQWELHSEALVDVFKGNELEFIELWRQSFVDNMKPRFLPEIWSVSFSAI